MGAEEEENKEKEAEEGDEKERGSITKYVVLFFLWLAQFPSENTCDKNRQKSTFNNISHTGNMTERADIEPGFTDSTMERHK